MTDADQRRQHCEHGLGNGNGNHALHSLAVTPRPRGTLHVQYLIHHLHSSAPSECTADFMIVMWQVEVADAEHSSHKLAVSVSRPISPHHSPSPVAI